jgi:RNA polymerase sigma factor (sigma-70 family)
MFGEHDFTSGLSSFSIRYHQMGFLLDFFQKSGKKLLAGRPSHQPLAFHPRRVDNAGIAFPKLSSRRAHMDQGPSFENVLARLRQRDNDAATEVCKRFAQRLISLARKHLDDRIRRRIDPEDVAQSVLKSVFLRVAAGQFVLGDWDSLWGLLVRITFHKCHKWVDYFQAQARHLDREAPPPAGADDSNQSWQFLDREPTPPEAAILAETIDQVLHGLDEREQEMVTLSLQGHEVAEISERLGCTESKVYRLLRLIRQRLERMRGKD